MSEHVYKNIEITGSSTLSSDDAVVNAIARAAKTIHHMDWFEIVGMRGQIDQGRIAHWQVTVKIGFRLED
ncbi:MAG: dodecin domain-containing protein [Gammaproteobacteria bacterium]|nr:dodecin domain-containing protein [Gammaproteobacteria bacterium]